jgi:hypothetical protein
MRARILAGLLLLAGACAKPAPQHSPTPVDDQIADQITDLVTEALRADARLEAADSLYEPGAVLVADGTRQTTLPRFAGISAGGQVQVGSSQVEVGQGFAWALLEYRWVAANANLAREARLSAVLLRSAQGTWHIVHGHSSSVR